jgi:hypothetical protein
MSEMIVVNDSTITTCAIAGLGSFSHAFRVSSSAAALGLARVALASPKGFADALCANGDAPLLAVDAAPASAKGDPPAGFEGAAAPKGDAGFAAGADGAAAPKGDAGLAAAGAAAPKGDAGVAAADAAAGLSAEVVASSADAGMSKGDAAGGLDPADDFALSNGSSKPLTLPLPASPNVDGRGFGDRLRAAE